MAKAVGEVIAYCPTCDKAIGDKNPYTWCIECGEPLSPEIKAKIPLLVEREQRAQEKQQRTGQAAGTVGDEKLRLTSGRNPVLNRYFELYRIARRLVTVGATVKVIGIVVGIGIVFFSLVAGGTGPASMVGALVFAGTFNGVIVGGFIALLGIIVAAQGQILRVQTDSAVHTSPFMTNDEKKRVMSL